MGKYGYLERILGIVCSVFDAYSAVLFLKSKEGAHFRLAAKFSLGDHVAPQCVIQAGKGLVGSMLSTNAPLLINDFDKKKARLEYYLPETSPNIKAFMGCMLKGGAGVICLDSKRTFSFSEKDQKILHLFSDLVFELHNQMQQFQENSKDAHLYRCVQLLQNLRKRVTKWDAYLDSFLKILSESTGYTYCFLCVKEEAGNAFTLEGSSAPFFKGNEDMRFSLGSGLVGWVLKNNKPVFVGAKGNDSTSTPLFGKTIATPPMKSLMCLPIYFSKDTRAVLGFAHEESVVISEQLKEFVNMAALNMELFLENLHVRSQLEMARAKPKKKA